MAAVDPFLTNFVALCFVALIINLVLQRVKQPAIIAYILTGLVIGPYGLKWVTDQTLISHLGSLGVLLLLFFVGMEISLEKLIRNWKIAILGTLLQIGVSVAIIVALGSFLSLPTNLAIFLGFVISLSSTALLIKILETKDLLKHQVGRDVISILLMQDLAIVPMMIFISTMQSTIDMKTIFLQVIGGLLLIAGVAWLLWKKTLRVPFINSIKKDHESQLLAAFVVCFSISLLTGLFQLSTALGAFFAGILIAATKEAKWVHDRLHAFKVLFMAFFFVSIGLLIDLDFLLNNFATVFALVILVFITNTFLNAGILRWLGRTWKQSIYTGALLAQIGEFSFLLASVGLEGGVISSFGSQIVVAVISVSLLLSPLWIRLFANVCNAKSFC